MRRVCIWVISALVLGTLGGCAAGQENKEPTEQGTSQAKSEEPTEQGTSQAKSEEPTTQGTSQTQSAADQHEIVPDGSRFLFIGNSHTFTNDLPGTFEGLAKAGGHEIEVHDLTQGGYSLKQFTDPRDEMGAQVEESLAMETWDIVVLQENTNSAVNGETEMYPYVRDLEEKIEKAGARTAFLMTWSPEDGAQGFSREMVQSVLSASYQKIAGETDAFLIPGGDLFLAALKQEPDLMLWAEDRQHPSPEGTYLAACGAYALFFGETPENNAYLGEVDAETAARLQKIAWTYMSREAEIR